MTSRKKSAEGREADDVFRETLEKQKRESTLQVLFKVARLLDELAVERVAARKRAPQLRRSHMSLLPHIALEGTRMSDLADELGISKQAVTQLVDVLEEVGVVDRVPDPDDARARLVVFTERGKREMFEGLRVLGELEDEVTAWIGARTMESLRTGLLVIHDRLTEGITTDARAPLPEKR